MSCRTRVWLQNIAVMALKNLSEDKQRRGRLAEVGCLPVLTQVVKTTRNLHTKDNATMALRNITTEGGGDASVSSSGSVALFAECGSPPPPPVCCCFSYVALVDVACRLPACPPVCLCLHRYPCSSSRCPLVSSSLVMCVWNCRMPWWRTLVLTCSFG